MWVWKAVSKFFALCVFILGCIPLYAEEVSEDKMQNVQVEESIDQIDDRLNSREPAARRRGKNRRFGLQRKKLIVPKSKDTIRRIKRQVIKVATPPRQFRQYFEEGTDEAALEEVINAEIKQLFSLIKTSSRRDLRLRLGSLYIEKVRLIEYRLYEKYDQDIKRFIKKQRAQKPRLNLRSTFVYVDKSIKLFETYRRQFPKDKYTDQVLFFLGVAYFKRGRLTDGKKSYERLVKKFPRSEYITDVNFELAEYHFNQSQWKKALSYYRRIVKNPRLKIYSFALYKLAWCYFNIGQVDRALVNMEAIIREGNRQKARGNMSVQAAGIVHFAKEALNDLVLFYSHSTRSPNLALSYFEKKSGSSVQAMKMLKRLAEAYLDSGHLKGVRITFKQLISEQPNSSRAYDYQYQIIRAYTSAGNRQFFLKELRYWLERFGPTSNWAKLNKHEPQILVKARTLMESTVRNYALQMHQSYRKTRDKVAKGQALFGYELYNKYFKQSKKSDQMHFFHAELLFDIGRYAQAGKYYQYLAENYNRSQYYALASLNSVLAFEKVLPSSQQIKKLVNKKTEFVPFTQPIHTFQKAADYYITHFPSKSNIPAIIYKKGEFHYEFNHHKDALDHFWHIVRKYPRSKYTEYAANLILDIHNTKKDFVALKEAAVQLLKNPTIARSPSAKDIQKIISQIALKSAEDMVKNKHYAKGAEMYQRFADDNPGSPLRLNAYYNAGFYYKESGDMLKALSIYNRVLQSRKATSKKLKQSILKEAPGIYESTGQYMKAAQAFSSYAKAFPNDKVSADFWYNSALIYDGFNRYSQAEQAYLMYFKKSKKAEKTQALYLLAEMLKRRGHITKAVSYYNQFLNRGSSDHRALVESAFKVAEIKKAKGQISQSKVWYQRTVNLYKKYKVGVHYAAQAEFLKVYDTYLRFIKIKIPASPRLQQKVVKEKLALLARLKEELKKVIRYDSGEQVIASLVLIGLASDHIGDAIYNSPIPRGLNKAEIQQYKAGLQKTVEPFKNEAVNNYELAVKKSQQLNNYDSTWIKKALDKLSQYNKSSLSTGQTVSPVTFYDWSGV